MQLAVASLRTQLLAERSAGAQTQLYLVFAGHGDIEAGQGYLELADGKLSARGLDELIAQLPAERIHLILDSCNSYFLLNPRKPGGKRWDSRQSAPQDLLSKYPQLGALLSTSAEAITYEWSELQSGVFSYEVRSGLRGAADVDGDGRITYAEIAAFIHVANRPVVNELYRPKVFSRAPHLDKRSEHAVLAQLPAASGRRLLLHGEQSLRLTLRDLQGVRLLDVHSEPGSSLVLYLPAEVALTAEQRVDGAGRPRYVQRPIPDGLQPLAALPEQVLDRSSRGESPLFQSLFAEPFGTRALATARLELDHQELPSDVSVHDVERLRLHLSLMAQSARETRVETALGLLLSGTLPNAALSYSIYRESAHTSDWVDRTGFGAGVVTSLVTLGIASYFLTTRWSEEHLYDDFANRDYSSAPARAFGVPKAERALQLKAAESRIGRDVVSWVFLLGGAVNTVVGGVFLGSDLVAKSPLHMAGPISLLAGLCQVVFGIYTHYTPSTLENVWATYSRDPAIATRRP